MPPATAHAVAVLQTGAAAKKIKPRRVTGVYLILSGMNKLLHIVHASAEDVASIKEMLVKANLPVEDLPGDLQHFFVAKENEKIIGAAGIEIYGNSALLRSVVSDPQYRNTGIATQLITALFDYAKVKEIDEIYLLTETAESYFTNRGFIKIRREYVPEEIKQSSEFTHICPSTAAVMKKTVMPKKKVLFVCIENSNRSQMSQAFAKILGGENVEAYSAGSKPSGIVNPKAIAAMKELGYDLSKHDSKSLEEVKQYAPFDAVVTMGCGDACPWMPAKKFIDWQIPDPKHMEPEDFNKVRDGIKEKVNELLKELSAENA